MTDTIGGIGVALVPHIYGASQLGVLSVTAPGPAHPRVEYVGGDLFVGLDERRDGAATGRRAPTRPRTSPPGRSS